MYRPKRVYTIPLVQWKLSDPNLRTFALCVPGLLAYTSQVRALTKRGSTDLECSVCCALSWAVQRSTPTYPSGLSDFSCVRAAVVY